MVDKMIQIKDIHVLSSNVASLDQLRQMYAEGVFHHLSLSKDLSVQVPGIMEHIESRLKMRMSQLSLGVYQVLQAGGAKHIKETDEIYLFSAFAEIETTRQIMSDIVMNESRLVSPTAFHNSVHNTPLGYYSIINKLHNYTLTISDGINTGRSFIDFIKRLIFINPDFIVVAGDEFSSFYDLEVNEKRDLFPFFISFRIVASREERGFRLLEETSDDKKIGKIVSEFDRLIVGKNIFNKLRNAYGKEKEILTDYPITADQPTGIVTRLALPFIFNLKGRTGVVEYHFDKYFLFEVVL